jgi:hypothetical protein
MGRRVGLLIIAGDYPGLIAVIRDSAHPVRGIAFFPDGFSSLVSVGGSAPEPIDIAAAAVQNGVGEVVLTARAFGLPAGPASDPRNDPFTVDPEENLKRFG